MVNKQWLYLIWRSPWGFGLKTGYLPGAQRRGISPVFWSYHKPPFWWGWYLKDEGKLYEREERSTRKEVEENIHGIGTNGLIWLEMLKCQPSATVLLERYLGFKVIVWLNATRGQCLCGLNKFELMMPHTVRE